jgi:hypothetical protein
MREFIQRLIVALYCIFIAGSATYSQGVSYPQNYFASPLNIPLELAGNFGEFRPNHFHTGLDFKTQQKENLPVFAVADGYVSRIAVSHTGYGYCLYINHPNGYTSVYAHLNGFSAPIDQYLKQEQIKAEKWNVDIAIDTPILIVKKGQQVALSGNTGGSVAPHLHFEIRDTKTEKVLNAMHYGFKIKDNIAPTLKKIVCYNPDISIYAQQLIEKWIVSKNGQAYIDENLLEWPYNKIYFGIVGVDYMNGSTNTLGIYQTRVYANDKLIFKTQMDELDFSYSRHINGYTDYKYRYINKDWVHILTKARNNKLDFYRVLDNNGILTLTENEPQSVRIIVEDYYGNQSELNFNVIYKKANNPIAEKKKAMMANVENPYFRFLVDANDFFDYYNLETSYQNGNFLSKKVNIGHAQVPLVHSNDLFIKILHPISFMLRSKLVFYHSIQSQDLPGIQAQVAMKATYQNGYAHAKIKTLGQYFIGIDTIPPAIENIKVLKKEGKIIVELNVVETITQIKSFKAFMGEQFIVFARKGNKFTSELILPTTNQKLKLIVSDDNDNTRTEMISI